MSDFSSAAFCATFATFLGSEREKKMDGAQKAVRERRPYRREGGGKKLFRDNTSCGVGERVCGPTCGVPGDLLGNETVAVIPGFDGNLWNYPGKTVAMALKL